MSLPQFYINPLIIINMGAEMLYIIDQRLRAQNISLEKSDNVMNDLINNLLTDQLLSSIKTPAITYSQSQTRKYFETLAHCSIMKLNQTSMSKLYDLMAMGFKRQIILSNGPQEIYLITLQHFDGIQNLVKNNTIIQKIQSFRNTFIQQYQNLRPHSYIIFRNELLRFLQDKQVRVQLFLQNNQQNQQGIFIIKNDRPVAFGINKPGQVKVFSNGQVSQIFNIQMKCYYKETVQSNYFEGKTELGKNMYLADPVNQENNKKQLKIQHSIINEEQTKETLRAKEELNILAEFIKGKQSHQSEEMRQQFYSINLFNNVKVKQEESIDEKFDELVIIDKNSASQIKKNIDKFFEDTEKPNLNNDQDDDDDGDDLLALMDKASKK